MSKAAKDEKGSSLQQLAGVGPQLAKKLNRLGIMEVKDLLFHLPLRYQDRTRVTSIRDLQAQNSAVIFGQIEASDIRFGRRRSLLISVGDDTGSIVLRFFHFSRSQQLSFKAGAWIQCFGEPRRGTNTLEMVHPEYRIYQHQIEPKIESSLTPVYPTTEGIGPALIRKLVSQVLEKHSNTMVEILPDQIRQEFDLMDISAALYTTHRPSSDSDTKSLIAGTHPSQQRLSLEEMLAHFLALKRIRNLRQQETAACFGAISKSWQKLEQSLPFKLTRSQDKVISEIFGDIERSQPSLRLIQGDVGSGKTIVAAAAALKAIDSGFQVALMAPTELLAEQHRLTFEHWFDSLEFGPRGLNIQWLTGKLSAPERRQSLVNISNGNANLIIGTHALFQQDVEFHKLGLIIVDEQHRFGVEQRLALRNKGEATSIIPHQLIMSATPIPRSLAMILYADLDISSIDELPPGRKPVQTIVVPDSRRDEIAQRIQCVCAEGQQVYWVCPLVEESDKLQAQAATQTATILQSQLPELRVALIHGKLKSSQKDNIMQRFNAGEIDLLVATTVIEVGVNVPNASLMVIENAERLGLAQLHQLRGRVGRGADQASCVLMYQPPLGDLAKQRLSILRETSDGFKIAQKDLEQRGPGELLGTRQAGLAQMKIADLARDRDLIGTVEAIASKLANQYPKAIPRIIQRWAAYSDHYSKV